ncbi:MAG: DNA repair protein RadA, partial [Bradyrhizobium sp.]
VLPESARGEVGGDAGMALNAVGGLTTLVAEIAARGTPREQRAEQRQGRDQGRDDVASMEKNATPTRFRRQDG